MTIDKEEMSTGVSIKSAVGDATLTPEQLNAVTKTLREEAEKNPNTKALRAILDGIEPDKDVVVEPKLQPLTPDPADLITEAPKKVAVSGLGGLTDDESMTMFNIMNSYKANNKFNVYAALPDKVKYMMRMQARAMGLTETSQVSRFSKLMIEQMCSEMQIDKEYAKLESDLQREMTIPSILDMYSEHTRSVMEEGLEDKAKQLDELHPDKAKRLRDISKSFTESYTLTRQYDLLKSDRKVIEKINKNSTKYFQRMCDHFDFKLSKSKFKVEKVGNLVKALRTILPLTEQAARKYVVVLCQTCENLSHEKIEDVWFMYYSVNNIISLAYMPKNKTEFSKTVLSNINKLVCDINDMEDDDCSI